MDIDEAYQKVVSGEIFDSKTMIAIMHAYINKSKSWDLLFKYKKSSVEQN